MKTRKGYLKLKEEVPLGIIEHCIIQLQRKKLNLLPEGRNQGASAT